MAARDYENGTRRRRKIATLNLITGLRKCQEFCNEFFAPIPANFCLLAAYDLDGKVGPFCLFGNHLVGVVCLKVVENVYSWISFLKVFLSLVTVKFER